MIALCAMIRDEAPYIREWVRFHRAQGVEEFLLFDDGSEDETVAILADEGIGVLPVVVGEFLPTQTYVLSQGLRRARSPWLLAVDVDEFMFGQGGRTLADVVREAPPEVGAFSVWSNVFGSGGQLVAGPEPVLQRFTRCGRPSPFGQKLLVRCWAAEGFRSAHEISLFPGWTLAHGPLALHHYAVKSFEECQRKSARWAERGSLRHGLSYWSSYDMNEFEDRSLAK